MSAEKALDPEKLRSDLAGFWNSALAVELTHDGLTLAMPQTDADGWQITLEILEATPGKTRISDAGRTLGGLSAVGQNVEAPTVAAHIESILRQSRMEREGLEIFRWAPLPLDPVEIHIFAEALSAVSQLRVLHEPVIRSQDVADRTLRTVFTDHSVTARAGVVLTGKTEKAVRVDYLVESQRSVAFQILRRRGRLLPVMEQWGYRWQDLRKVNTSLMPVMLYDPALQEVDDASRAIGQEVCSLFCAYDETDRIHDVLTDSMTQTQ